MKKISVNDVIFARATMMGRELLNLRITGLASMEALLSRLKDELGAFMGMVSISIRNISQGWTQNRTYLVA